jgi:O-antigen/teichoic acid export membrane protein
MGKDTVAAQITKGSFFTIGASATTLILGFVRSVLLARLLAPEDFGTVALALFFLSLMNQMTDLGFQRALIHRDTDLEKATSMHFVLKVGFSVLMFLATIVLSPVLSHFYPSQPQMVSALVVLSCAQIIRAVNATPDVILRKDMDFRYIAVLDVASSLSMMIVAPAMALAGLGFWSLVGEQVAPILVRALGLWVFRRPWNLSLCFDKEIARWYFGFGFFVFLSSGFTSLLDQFDDFWTGTALGARALGFYSRAYEFARYPRRIIGTPIAQVFFPAYAKLQHDHEKLSKAYYQASSLMIRLGFLFSLVFVLIVPEFIHVFLGSKWLPMALTFRLMILYTLLDPLVNTSDHLLTAVGRPQVLARIRALQLLIFVPTVIVLAHYSGINGVAIAADLMLVIGLIYMLVEIRRFVTLSLWKMFRYPTLGLLLGGGIAIIVSQYLVVENDVLSLFLKGGLASVGYIGVLLTFERREHKNYIDIIRRLIRPSE